MSIIITSGMSRPQRVSSSRMPSNAPLSDCHAGTIGTSCVHMHAQGAQTGGSTEQRHVLSETGETAAAAAIISRYISALLLLQRAQGRAPTALTPTVSHSLSLTPSLTFASSSLVSPSASHAITPSRAVIQLRLPRSVLISPEVKRTMIQTRGSSSSSGSQIAAARPLTTPLLLLLLDVQHCFAGPLGAYCLLPSLPDCTDSASLC